jgi:hypothetical protein
MYKIFIKTGGGVEDGFFSGGFRLRKMGQGIVFFNTGIKWYLIPFIKEMIGQGTFSAL